ncbi:baeRF12 domain-containing protein [Azospirillum agricola]|uniref:baeRF12 domain-containing protein n=1 Tax=Azospirillum agricola TaxID=1720247 RepID=UPI000A0F00E5|nr:host attachment protein [Azospirillum agricola]SMH46104.1 Protein required for attachment to host cells [Azospirillum lipoferum]
MHRGDSTWIVLANQTGAVLLRRRPGPDHGYEELTREAAIDLRMPESEKPDHPAPGTPAYAATGQPMTERGTSAQDIAATAFEQRVAALVNQAAMQGMFDSLILVAPSATLRTLRRALSPQARLRLTRQEAKDLLGTSAQTLPARLRPLLRG